MNYLDLLPTEVLHLIFEYDSTYHNYFTKVMKDVKGTNEDYQINKILNDSDEEFTSLLDSFYDFNTGENKVYLTLKDRFNKEYNITLFIHLDNLTLHCNMMPYPYMKDGILVDILNYDFLGDGEIGETLLNYTTSNVEIEYDLYKDIMSIELWEVGWYEFNFFIAYLLKTFLVSCNVIH